MLSVFRLTETADGGLYCVVTNMSLVLGGLSWRHGGPALAKISLIRTAATITPVDNRLQPDSRPINESWATEDQRRSTVFPGVMVLSQRPAGSSAGKCIHNNNGLTVKFN